MTEQAHVVGHEPDVALGDGLAVGHDLTEHAHFAGIGSEQPGHEPDARALAGAVGADKTHDLAGLEVERQVFEREEAERLPDIAHLDVFRLGHFLSTVRMARRSRVARSSGVRPSCWPMPAAAARCSSSFPSWSSPASPFTSATNEPLPWRVTMTPSFSRSR